MTQKTGFHSRTSARTSNFTEYCGYWLALDYSDTDSEYRACREKAVAVDLSPLRKFEVLGPDAEALLQYCLPRDISRLAAGQITYTALCDENGMMLDDGTLFRLNDTDFRWIGGNDGGGDWLRQQAEQLKLNVRVKPCTDELHNLSVQGPLSREIMRAMIWAPPRQPTIDELGWFRFLIGRLGGEHGAPLLVSRTGYSGELGYEIFCHPKDAETVWDAVFAAGEPLGLLPLGLNALDVLRIEAGLIFAGYEFDNQTDPFAAGIGFVVSEKKTEDYISRAALEQVRQNPRQLLVGLELEGKQAAANGDAVYSAQQPQQQVGVITSGALSPILNKNIALCRMAAEQAANGTAAEVCQANGGRSAAKVVPLPFYDPEKKKPRS